MRAAVVTALAGPSAVRILETEEPQGPGVLIEVSHAGVIFPDILMSRGLYQMKQEVPFVLGSEGAGQVLRTPPNSGFSVGDRVAFHGRAAFAERVLVPPANLIRLPSDFDAAAAACLPINYQTAVFALSNRGRFRAGESLLVLGAAGGVGTAAIQTAKALAAGRIIGVTSTEEKAALARQAGADATVLLQDDWWQQVLEANGGSGVDLAYDPVGGTAFLGGLRSLARYGRLLVIGFASGTIPEVRVNRLLLRNVEVIGAAWGEAIAADPKLHEEVRSRLEELVQQGALAPPVEQVLPLVRAADALRHIEARKVLGRIVLSLGIDN